MNDNFRLDEAFQTWTVIKPLTTKAGMSSLCNGRDQRKIRVKRPIEVIFALYLACWGRYVRATVFAFPFGGKM